MTEVFLEPSRPSRRCCSTSSFSPSTKARPAAIALLAAAFVVTASSDADAIERQHHIGLAPAIGILQIDGKSTSSTGAGAGGALHYTYGLTDQWNLTVEAGRVIVAADQDFPYSPASVDHGAVGAAYVIDILRWVPYIGVAGGLYRLSGGTLDEALFLPGLSVGAGIDYQLNRHFAVGLAGRQHVLLSKLDTYPSYTTLLFRFEYMWGY